MGSTSSTTGTGGSSGIGGGGGMDGGGGTDGGGPVVVDTSVVDEALGRVERAGERSREAADGLDRLPVTGVVVGADAVLDALADLGRQWTAHLDDATDQARATVERLRAARTEYVRVEREAELFSRSWTGRPMDQLVGGAP